ncbi:MAG: histidine phosphatase family protein [Marmoricola sp.]
MTHRLILIRHGEAQPMASTDRQRELTTRGRAGAKQAGAWLATIGSEPNLALVSSATRTMSTWRDVCAGAGWSGSQAHVLDEVYDAGAGALLALIGATDESLQSLVVVGHNPAIASLAFGLDDLQAEATDSLQLATSAWNPARWWCSMCHARGLKLSPAPRE